MELLWHNWEIIKGQLTIQFNKFMMVPKTKIASFVIMIQIITDSNFTWHFAMQNNILKFIFCFNFAGKHEICKKKIRVLLELWQAICHMWLYGGNHKAIIGWSKRFFLAKSLGWPLFFWCNKTILLKSTLKVTYNLIILGHLDHSNTGWNELHTFFMIYYQ